MTQYVQIPQHITGDFSENGCIGKTMEKTEAEKMYGKEIIETLAAWEEGFQTRSTCTKACEMKQKHAVVCNFNFRATQKVDQYTSDDENIDDISGSEEKMGVWGY